MEKLDIYEHDDNCRYALGKNGKKMIICIGLNPSTATDKTSDRTFNKICKIAENNKYDGFVLLNICPKISSNPKNVKYNKNDADKNCQIIIKYLDKYPNAPIWRAWGNNIRITELKQYRKSVEELISTREYIYTSLNKSGEPKHPLFEKFDADFKKI